MGEQPVEATVALLAPLRLALARGDQGRLQDALATPGLIPALLRLPAEERAPLVAEVFAAFDTIEDAWELVEAAAMDTLARPANGALLSVIPSMPTTLVLDVRSLIATWSDTDLRVKVIEMLNAREATDPA